MKLDEAQKCREAAQAVLSAKAERSRETEKSRRASWGGSIPPASSCLKSSR